MHSLPVLEARELAIGYAGRGAIQKGLNLSLPAGQLVCLMGPNGVGKTTLLRTLAGLHPPLAGEISLAGRPLAGYSRREIAQRIAVVLTERLETASLTAYEVVALGRFPYQTLLGRHAAADETAIQLAFEQTGIRALAARRMGTLSDGERQKVWVARALAQASEVLLLDEPTAHLDIPARLQLFHLLRSISRQSGKAILLATHDLEMALQLADSLWLLTASGLHTGPPEALVLDGSLQEAFGSSNLDFDIQLGSFRLAPVSSGPTVGVVGPDPIRYWTTRALEREGFHVSQTSGTTIHCLEGPRWSIGDTIYNSLQAALQAIKTLGNPDSADYSR